MFEPSSGDGRRQSLGRAVSHATEETATPRAAPPAGRYARPVGAFPDVFFSSVLDVAPDGMIVVDGEGEIVFANKRAGTLFGVAFEELIGSSVDELLPVGLRSVHRAHRLRYRADPTVRPMGIDIRLRARRVDGTEFPVEVSLSPLVDGGTFHVVAAIRDVTSRVEADEAMRRVLRTLDAAEDALFVMDPVTLRFDYVNDGACRQVGYSREQLIGMTPMHINPELTEDQLRAAVQDAPREDEAPLARRSTHRRRDGTDVPVELGIRSASPDQDGVDSVILVARDITARLAYEEQLRRSEDAVREAERVMAIADDRERIARDLHDTVIQRLFASGLALQAVAARSLPEVQPRLEQVVDDLDLTIREIRTAIFSLQATGAAERGVRARVLDVIGEAARNLGFEPRLVLDGPLETIDSTVADELLPTVREALSNVARHARATSVRVSVEVHDGLVRLVVDDDGIGIGALQERGHGLENMSIRAGRLGGSLSLEPKDDDGTRLAWTVPSSVATREASPPADPIDVREQSAP
jgi:PAS domain S-box-containing protein